MSAMAAAREHGQQPAPLHLPGRPHTEQHSQRNFDAEQPCNAILYSVQQQRSTMNAVGTVMEWVHASREARAGSPPSQGTGRRARAGLRAGRSAPR